MQEVIVYRNPVEAAIWHALSSASLIPIIAGVISFFIVFLAANRLLTRGVSWNAPQWKTNLALLLGVGAGSATTWWLWL